MSIATRATRLADSIGADVDAILVTKLVNVRYLTGFTGSNAAALVHRDGRVLLATDGRYRVQASSEAPDVELVITRALGPDLIAAAVRDGARRVAIERHHVTLAGFDALRAAGPGVELVGAGEAVERLRVAKDDTEIEALRRACAATDAAFHAVVDRLRPGITEREVAWELLTAIRAAGGDGSAFESIVAFGPHSAIPHHRPTERTLQPGDLVKLDFGALVDGYHADMTRTVVCGPAQDWQRELHASVRDVQSACRAATIVGAVPVELDQLAQRLIAESGHQLVHGLGHGVGLEIHEQPFLVPASGAARLDDRVAVTVEPGVYLPGRGGVRIEDTVLVAEQGPEPLTTSTRDLLEI